jgi:MFS family permease
MSVPSGPSSARGELAQSWRFLLGAFLGVAAGINGMPYYTQGVFVPPLTGEFGWSREQMSLIVLAGGVVLAVMSPCVGWVVDRVGVRVPLILSFGAMASGYLFLGLGLSGSVFTYFFLLQVSMFAFGSFTGPVAFTRVVNQRFDAMRGLALGIALAGAGAMAVLAPPFVAHIVEVSGWRAAYRAVALVMIAVAFVALFLLWPAGGVTGARGDKAGARVEEDGQGADRVLFWRLLGTFVLLALGVGGFTFHMVPLLTDAGVPLTRAAEIQSLIGFSVLAGRVGSGFLMDRFFAPRISALVIVLAALGVLGLAVLGPAAAAPSAVLIGFALGAEGDVIGYLTARYFGMQNYGRLYGALYGVFALGLGISPVLISRMQAVSGSYQAALWVSLSVLLLGAMSMLTLPRFSRRV